MDINKYNITDVVDLNFKWNEESAYMLRKNNS